jgi:hypothetical protein
MWYTLINRTHYALWRTRRIWKYRQPLCWNFMYHSRIVLSVGRSVWYMVRNLRCIVTSDSVLANSKTQTAFLFPLHAMFRLRLPPRGETCKYATAPRTIKTWRDNLPTDMLLSALSVLVVAQPSSEIPQGLMNYPIFSGHDVTGGDRKPVFITLTPQIQRIKCYH